MGCLASGARPVGTRMSFWTALTGAGAYIFIVIRALVT